MERISFGSFHEHMEEVDHKLIIIVILGTCVVEGIGNTKRDDGMSIYAPTKCGRLVNDRALALNEDPFPVRTVEGIDREQIYGRERNSFR